LKVTHEILQGEFIGLRVKVTKSANSSHVGILGTIVDETRNTFVIREEEKKRIVAKNQAVLEITLPDSAVVEIDGKYLVGRPEDRLKRRTRRLW
jgi:ribonuclease P protein subunit POP4